MGDKAGSGTGRAEGLRPGEGAVTEAALREAMAQASGVAGPKGETRLPPGWVAIARRRIPPRQSRVTLSLDADVAAFFRGMGRGHQARMNDVLRAFMLGCQAAERSGKG